MRHTISMGILTLALLLLALPALASDTPWAGTWRYAGGSQEETRRSKAIELATEDVSFMMRGKVRSKLSEKTKPAPRLSLALRGDEVTIVGVAGQMALTLGAPPVTKSGPGGKGQLSARKQGDALVLTVQGDNGRRITTFERIGENLLVTVSLQAGMLSEPLKVRSTYAPAP